MFKREGQNLPFLVGDFMKTSEILNLRCDTAKNRDILRGCVLKADKQKRTLKSANPDTMQLVIKDLCLSGGYRLQPVKIDYDIAGCQVWYTASIMDAGNKWCGNVYGETIWELFAKLIVKLYSEERKKVKNHVREDYAGSF